MNNRERILAVLDGKPPDRIPFAPRIALWYNARIATDTMPTKFKGMSLREVERELGIGTPARNGRVFSIRVEDVETVHRDEGGSRITEHHTPVGMIRSSTHYSDDLKERGMGGREEEFLLKGAKDYAVWEYMWEHTYWDPEYEAYEEYDADIGDEGMPMVGVGDAPFHHYELRGPGYSNAFYHVADYPDEVDHLMAVMTEVQRERQWPVIAESPARMILHGVHHSSAFTPPPIYEKYILPYYEAFMPVMHEHGKSVAMHADNDTSLILGQLQRAGYDMLECFVTAPMVPLTLAHAREVLGTRVSLYGGIPSLIMSASYPEEDFRAYIDEMFRVIAPGDAIILGVADNVMPDSVIERVAYISEQVHKRGWYPIGG